MSEFKFGYESQNHKIEIQIPVCLFGKPDSDLLSGISNLVGTKKEEDPEETKTGIGGIFKKKSAETKPAVSNSGIVSDVAKTSAMLLSSMVLSALKN